MGWPSCFEVISEKLAESRQVADQLSAGKMSTQDASRVIAGVLKQCHYVGEFASDFLPLSKLPEQSLLAQIYDLRERLHNLEKEKHGREVEIQTLLRDHAERGDLLRLKNVDLEKYKSENSQLRRRLRNPAAQAIKSDIAKLSDLTRKKNIQAAAYSKKKSGKSGRGKKGVRVWRADDAQT
jgi:hypothetical protein